MTFNRGLNLLFCQQISICWKDIIFQLNGLCVIKNTLSILFHRCMFMWVPYCLNYPCFELVSFEIKMCESFILFFFSMNCFGYSVSISIWILGSTLSFINKSGWNLIWLSLNLQINFKEYCHVNNIRSSMNLKYLFNLDF